jgi:hypothetical protein
MERTMDTTTNHAVETFLPEPLWITNGNGSLVRLGDPDERGMHCESFIPDGERMLVHSFFITHEDAQACFLAQGMYFVELDPKGGIIWEP